MLKFLIVLVISFSTYVSAKETKFEKRLHKDIKKLLRISGFIDDDLINGSYVLTGKQLNKLIEKAYKDVMESKK